MLGRTFITVISALSLLVPAASFAQVEQQQSQQQTRSQSRQDQQTQQSRYGPGQGQQQASITSDVQVTSQGELSEEERRSLSLAAGRLLKHVHQARQAIHQQQKQQAMGHIDKGLTLAQIIESAVPIHEVTARIQAGDMTYEDKERVKQLIVPIYTELEKVTLMAPLRAAKQEAAKNGGSARELSPGKPSQQSPSARPSQPSQPAMTPVVAGVEVHHTHIMLDVSAAKEHLRAAKQALNNDKDEAADGALAAGWCYTGNARGMIPCYCWSKT